MAKFITLERVSGKLLTININHIMSFETYEDGLLWYFCIKMSNGENLAFKEKEYKKLVKALDLNVLTI